jgi:hypothetical protein
MEEVTTEPKTEPTPKAVLGTCMGLISSLPRCEDQEAVVIALAAWFHVDHDYAFEDRISGLPYDNSAEVLGQCFDEIEKLDQINRQRVILTLAAWFMIPIAAKGTMIFREFPLPEDANE